MGCDGPYRYHIPTWNELSRWNLIPILANSLRRNGLRYTAADIFTSSTKDGKNSVSVIEFFFIEKTIFLEGIIGMISRLGPKLVQKLRKKKYFPLVFDFLK